MYPPRLLPSVLLVLLGTAAIPGRATDASDAFPSPDSLPVLANLPDPPRNADGTPAANPAQWAAARTRMKAILEHYALGHAPPPPGNVQGAISHEQPVLGGQGTYRLVNLTFGPGERLHLQVALFLPGDGKEVYPTIVLPNFMRTPGGDPTPGVPATARQLPITPDTGAGYAAPILQRGYAVVTYDYQQAGLDRPENRASGFFPAYPDYDWSTEAVWAWGLSRVVDYLETQPGVDKTRIIAAGHSRLGKMVLIAGAFDERIALSVPAGSGTGGTAAYRFTGPAHGGGESFEHVVQTFPHWFSPRLAEFTGQVDKLPFDAHWFIALTAPRALLTEDGLEDPGVNVSAVVRSYRAAKPVYDLLDAGDRLGICFRPGGHHLQADDWAIILDFADRELRGLKVERKFDEPPILPEQKATK